MHTTSRLFHPTRSAAVDEFFDAIPNIATLPDLCVTCSYWVETTGDRCESCAGSSAA